MRPQTNEARPSAAIGRRFPACSITLDLLQVIHPLQLHEVATLAEDEERLAGCRLLRNALRQRAHVWCWVQPPDMRRSPCGRRQQDAGRNRWNRPGVARLEHETKSVLSIAQPLGPVRIRCGLPHSLRQVERLELRDVIRLQT